MPFHKSVLGMLRLSYPLYVCVCMFLSICVCIYVCLSILSIFVCVFMCMSLCVYIYMSLSVSICVYM